MFRNYLAAALRNMLRNRLYAAINTIGLAVGFAAALLVALFIRDELTFERWIPGAERTFLLAYEVHFNNGFPTVFGDNGGNGDIVPALSGLPGVEGSARLYNAPMFRAPLAGLRRGDVEAEERLYWADPNFLSIVPLPMVAGDPQNALSQPDAVVITRRMARKYFGRDDARGETIEMDRAHAMTVTAVIEDLPSNTHLDFDVLASARAPFSDLATLDATPIGKQGHGAFTYVRLKPNASVQSAQDALPSVFERTGLAERLAFQMKNGVDQRYFLRRIAEVYHSQGTPPYTQKLRGNLQTSHSLAVVALCLMLLACMNFASLTTARGAQRAVEVGVRKVSGAFRLDLALQFIGESLLTTAIAMATAVATVTLLLPRLNALLSRNSISLDLAGDGTIAATLLGITVLVGVIAGLYPALVLPAFKMVSVLKGGPVRGTGTGRARQVVVAFQFAVLIALILTSAIVYRQTQFAFNEGMRLDTQQVLLVRTTCGTAFPEEVAKLPGIAATACSSNEALNYEWSAQATKRLDGTETDFDLAAVGPGFFELYGFTPVAGRFFARDNPMDNGDAPTSLVLNEAAVRDLGYATNEAVLGQLIEWPYVSPKRTGAYRRGPYEVVGVVPDFYLDAVHKEIRPTAYTTHPAASQILSVKLNGGDIPETLAAIDRVWAASGEHRAITRSFLDQRVQELHLDITRQSQFFTALSVVAIAIAALGLFALSAFTAEQRTKEIGIRKSMGANRGDIIRLLLWQFAKPVLWANVIAWPAAYLIMRGWLDGFAYHVDIAPWMFIASSGLAVVIALLTVVGHALWVARAQPVTALRYE